MARDGVRFTRGYVTAPQCVPSRAGVLTGRYQQRFGVEDNNKGPLPLAEQTIAERLKAAGYVTGQVGKWHLDLVGGKKGDKPVNRYLYVTFTVFDEPTWDHVTKIREWAVAKEEGDPRSDAVAIGKWGKTVEVNGKNYADFTLREISRCVWGPLNNRAAK
jgi:arylsulfatase A-like enzyme